MTRTLFIVSSKSGSTSEPNVLKDYSSRGSSRRSARTRPAANRRVTDPGYGAGQDREADRFRRVFLGQPNIGGPYSVLSPFGLVPAAASGVDKPRKPWCGRAGTTCRRPTIPIGVVGREERDKVTLFSSPKLVDFGAWAEQRRVDRKEW
jgi:transaldolase / glucose-6-phosphate isomerase